MQELTLMTPSVSSFNQIISSHLTQSYKLATAHALLELRDSERIPLTKFAEPIALVYYQHSVYYKLKESPPHLPAVAETIIQKMAEKYYEDGFFPFKPKKKVIDEAVIRMTLTEQSNIFRYVLHAWNGDRRYGRKEGANSYFRFSKNQGWIEPTNSCIRLIRNERTVLKDLLAHQWTKYLGRYNDVPRIAQKISDQRPNRNLQKFKNLFLKHPHLFSIEKCWLCGEGLPENEWSIDHVVPFSFQYGNELWNLVPAHGACNSKKGDRIGSQGQIERTKRRNQELWNSDVADKCREFAESKEKFVSALEESVSKASIAGFRSFSG